MISKHIPSRIYTTQLQDISIIFYGPSTQRRPMSFLTVIGQFWPKTIFLAKIFWVGFSNSDDRKIERRVLCGRLRMCLSAFRSSKLRNTSQKTFLVSKIIFGQKWPFPVDIGVLWPKGGSCVEGSLLLPSSSPYSISAAAAPKRFSKVSSVSVPL